MSKKKKRKPKKRVQVTLAAWTPINFHPKTGANLKGKGYAIHKKTGKVHQFTGGGHD